MVRTTEHPWNGRGGLARTAGTAVGVGLALVMLFAMAGCSSAGSTGQASGQSTQATASATASGAPGGGVGAHMAGQRTTIHISSAALEAKPKPWVLKTPEDAVRSYLDWTAYSFRIGTSDVATATMSGNQWVRTDAYIQFNLEQKRLIDETLTSLTVGKASVGPTSTLVPAKELWSYRYASTDQGNKTVGGPYTASYDTTYTVVKKKGVWVVDSVKATPHGTVK
jgi:hypothetical protein